MVTADRTAGKPATELIGRNGDPRGVCPELLQSVERSGPWIEEMNHYIAAIQQDPTRIRRRSTAPVPIALNMSDRRAQTVKDDRDMLPERVDLWGATRSAENKKIGHAGQRAQIHDDDILGLLVHRRLRGGDSFQFALWFRASWGGCRRHQVPSRHGTGTRRVEHGR